MTVISRKASLVALLALLAGGCAQQPANQPYDPLEPFNRAMFGLNEGIDRVALEPAARAWRAVAPQPVRSGLRNFLRNLKSPLTIANQALQGDFSGALTATGRMLVNSTVGLGGLFDVAEDMGWTYEPEDFGQTLGVWGFGPGPYLVLPIIGALDLRDGVGYAVDVAADPLNLWLSNTGEDEWIIARGVATAIDRREAFIEVVDDLRKNSLDYYAATRSSYLQNRAALIGDGEASEVYQVTYPDYDEGEE